MASPSAMIRVKALLTAGFYITQAFAGPCDIYASADTPCVAAHSTTRALYDSYTGPLYQISRGSDGAKTDISPLANGVADAATQDSFCTHTTCLITIIYDQSGRDNHLTQAPPGGEASGPSANGYDNLASAIGAPITLQGGKKAYGVFISPNTGYRIDNTSGVATGDEPEGIYAVLDGTHYNTKCCFDYGNAETNNKDTGNGHMEAVYFGADTVTGSGNGSGPWIMADLENGLFSGYKAGNNVGDPTISSRFVTAIVKGKPNQWAIRGGDATYGSLATFYSGQRPANGYFPMHKEGAIILGIGGDNSNKAQGTFYEGVMTSGYPSDATEDSVQADIVAAGYAEASLTSGPPLTIGSSISLRATTACCTSKYIAHNDTIVELQEVDSTSKRNITQQEATWIVRAGLGNSGCYSFESLDTPGSFIRHSSNQLMLNANDGSKVFNEDATFCPEAGLNGQGNSLRSWNYPTRYWRHYNGILYIASNGGPQDYDSTVLFNDDVSFIIGSKFA